MKIKIKNFGPIKQGFTDTSDGFFEIKKIIKAILPYGVVKLIQKCKKK